MVSFWPFRGGEDNAESFEKALSKLSTQINKTSAQNERFRQQQRRYKALWTLYTSFIYILVAAILTLVTGWDRWSYFEYTAVAGGPVIIYGVRTALDAYFNYRISNSQNHLNDLTKQREATIERLKTATKYNSTQQLLEKYGGSPPRKRQPSPQPKAKRKSEGGQGTQGTPQQTGRTGFAPPPTANIPGRQSPPAPPPPQGEPGSVPRPSTGLAPPQPAGLMPPPDQSGPGEDFAPNAFSSPPRPSIPPIRQPSQYATEGPKWYDRILDVVLGEDETQAKNRIALICQSCKLVNGQAPPGARTLEDIGRWRCSSCHAWNGVESEEKRILQQMSQGGAESPTSPVAPFSAATDPGPGVKSMSGEAGDDEEDEDELEDGQPEEVEVETPSAGSTRSKARQRKA
ncbi:hypothetical protein M409DRAFT_54454 [Zasmidium cellare ATCC 36951]|uniref:Endoplasmic reticulum junction formation protein lunapark n=1 Tax=Zasmidium cellare ATCC 36951 TaxID=1080233 RepID=A0A6A6CNG3_ZASCE|nr:uncharacterized protein M409DRAFT_54454 [Zasmidium cellare ATCC 36951]KAF2167279.1 hypothetical protein M409DRAFT_54454 [Zasmidium cellare ATCC 36951]